MANLLYTNKIEYGSPSSSFTARTEKFQTDSYSIRAAVGINSIQEQYDVAWAGLTEAEATALINQLKTAKGIDLLQWQPPLATSAYDFTCDKFSFAEYPGDVLYYTVNATLTREYDN